MIYTAITIGPIIETLSLSSSPAALWASSFTFSHITHRLCESIVNKKLVESEEDIISPYYSVNNEYDATKYGIGLYHDRIVFKPIDPEAVLDELNKCFKEVTKEISDLFDEQPEGWFEQYLQFHALNFESTANPILDCSQYLDAIELEKSFPVGETRNPISDLFESIDKNKLIRDNIRDKINNGKWPFPGRDEQMADMAQIIGRKTEKERPRVKTKSYYAIVQSDGDKFGDYIKSHFDPRAFSKQCLMYCNEVAMEIQDYGGVTIYAGGDDVLFIAPLSSPNIEDKNLLSLLTNLRDIFMRSFNKDTQQTDGLVAGQSNDLADKSPTVSFGVAIRYYKYPLYEAFSECLRLLFTDAKMERDSLAISLQKHSGQLSEFVLTNFSNNNLPTDLYNLIQHQINEECLQSIRGKIWEFKPLFLKALELDNVALENIFANTFDSDEHALREGDIKAVRLLLSSLGTANHKIKIVQSFPNGEDRQQDSKIDILDNLLRFVRFWGEKGVEEDE